MSYRCGMGRGMEAFGFAEGPPRVTCDCCGRVLVIRGDRLPPKWLLDGRPPPGWRTIRHEDGTRTDVCKPCLDPAVIIGLVRDRDDARARARVLAHSYENDSRPPDEVVQAALAYPAIPERFR